MRSTSACMFLACVASVTVSPSPTRAAWLTSERVSTPKFAAVSALPNGKVIVSGGRADAQGSRATSGVLLWDRASNAWSSAPPLLAARAEHRSLVLSDGGVLVVGGRDGPKQVSAAEVWHVGQSAWKAAGALAVPRQHVALLAMSGGRVLAVGGDGKHAPNACPAELWDPKTLAWTTIAEIPAWCGAVAAVFDKTKVMIAGGWDSDGARRDVSVWDPSARTLTQGSAMNAARASPAMFTLADGSVIVAGGDTAPANPALGFERFEAGAKRWLAISAGSSWAYDQAELLDGGALLVPDLSGDLWRFQPSDGTFTRFERAPLGNGQPVALPGGEVLMLGAERPQVFTERQPSVGVWRGLVRPPLVRTGSSLTVLADGRVFLAGGHAGSPGSRPERCAYRALRFEPEQVLWFWTGPLEFRDEHVSAALADGRILVAGGVDSSRFEPNQRRTTSYRAPWVSQAMVDSAEVWSPREGWKPTGALNEKRSRAASVVLPDGRVVVFGGFQHTYGPSYVNPPWLFAGPIHSLSSVEAWSPATGRFTPMTPMAEPRMDHTATLLTDGRVLVVGGAPSNMPGAQPARPAEIWDPRSNAWAAASSPHVPRRRHAALALADGRVIVAGGQAAGTAAALDSVELWDPRSNTWQLVRPMNATRQDFGMIRLSDGRVMVAGGTAGRQITPEVWDPKTDSWSFTGPPAGLTHGEERLVALRDGRVMLVDAASTQMWSAR